MIPQSATMVSVTVDGLTNASSMVSPPAKLTGLTGGEVNVPVELQVTVSPVATPFFCTVQVKFPGGSCTVMVFVRRQEYSFQLELKIVMNEQPFGTLGGLEGLQVGSPVRLLPFPLCATHAVCAMVVCCWAGPTKLWTFTISWENVAGLSMVNV